MLIVDVLIYWCAIISNSILMICNSIRADGFPTFKRFNSHTTRPRSNASAMFVGCYLYALENIFFKCGIDYAA